MVNSRDKAIDPEEVRLYRSADDLSPALWDDLAALDAARVRQRAGVSGGYDVPFLGRNYRVMARERRIKARGEDRTAGFQTGLVILNYLIHAKEDGLTGRMVTGRELNGGDMFFKGPHALSTEPVLERFGRDAGGFLAAAARLGGVPVQGGDAAFRVFALPKILVAYTLYEADSEFPAGLTITFDAVTDRHLPLDSIWALVNVLSRRLAESGA